MTIKLDEVNRDIDILTPQSHKNITIIPLKTQINNKLNILTLKNGFELGLVQVKAVAETIDESELTNSN